MRDLVMAIIAQNTPGDNAPPYSVSAIAGEIKRTVEERFDHVRVRGELSGVKIAGSGHLYAALKDDGAVLDAVMWKGALGRLAFRPEDGLDVIVTGRVTTYPGRSRYQIVAESMELAGEGALLAMLEKLKARLSAEGMFDAARKRPLPYLPRIIGVVTSPTGAVIRDILHRLEDRCPTRVILWPVLVQGEGAAAQIAAAIRGFAALPAAGANADANADAAPVPRPDLLIVARGGGSIEDLMAFNDEAVVRAIADCPIAVISAVGHETDTSLSDYAADVRAPTPTAAAEMAVPVRAELLALLEELGARARRALARQLGQSQDRLQQLNSRLPPLERLLQPQRQRLDDAGERLPRALMARHALARVQAAGITARLAPALALRPVLRGRDQLAGLLRTLSALDPRGLLARGYAMVHDAQGGLITSAAQARSAPRLRLHFADGIADAAPLHAQDRPAQTADAPTHAGSRAGSRAVSRAGSRKAPGAAAEKQPDLFG